MPEGTRVHNCVNDVKAKGGGANPYAVCQASTGQNFHTGQKLDEDSVLASASSTGAKLVTERHPGGIEKLQSYFEGAETPDPVELPDGEEYKRLRKYCGGEGGQPGPCPTSSGSKPSVGSRIKGFLSDLMKGPSQFNKHKNDNEPTGELAAKKKHQSQGPNYGQDYATGGGGYF